jgi:transposase
MKGYSQDLRERVVALREDGKTQQQIADTLKMSVSTVKRYLERYQQTGSVAAAVQGRMKPRLGQAAMEVLRQQVEAHPDATNQWHAEQLAGKTGLVVSRWMVERALRTIAWTRKKRRLRHANAMR